MSIEAALAANTKALETHSALLEQLLKINGNAPLPIYGRASSADPLPAAGNESNKPTPAAETKTEAATSTAQPEATKTEPQVLTYKDAEKAILDLVKVKGRDAAIAAIGSVKDGAQKLPEILPIANDDKGKPLSPELSALAAKVIAAAEAKKAE